jgi:hypothetical protein
VGTGPCILSISGWRFREKAADAFHVIPVLITEALDQIFFLGAGIVNLSEISMN